MNPTDNKTLARFASGEMNAAEESEFLARCEIEPNLWRTAALALVEHRQLVAALQEFSETDESEPVVPVKQPAGGLRMRWPTAAITAVAMLAVMLGGISLAYRIGGDTNADLSQEADPSIIVCLPSQDKNDTVDETAAPLQADMNPEAASTELAALNSSPVFPDEARSVLRQVGVEVEEEPVLYLFDYNGESLMVPTRNFHLKYVNHLE